MLLAHLNSLEDSLLRLCQQLQASDMAEAARAPALRAALQRELLEPLFGAEWLITRGEVIASSSQPGDRRPVFDLLLCQRNAPLLRSGAGGGPTRVLAEAVVSAITVVPVLDEAAVQRAVQAACELKALPRQVLLPQDGHGQGSPIGQGLPAIPCQLLAFDGPAHMAAVHGWLKRAYHDQGITEADLPPTGDERVLQASPGLDGVFVLGRGFLNFDNVREGFVDDLSRLAAFGTCWAIATSERGALMSLYMQLQQAANAAAGSRWSIRPYLESFVVSGLRFGN